MSWKDLLPPKDRTVDLILTVGLAGVVAGYFQITEKRRQEEITSIQEDMVRLAHTMSEPAIATALLTFLSCNNAPEIRESAIKLLARTVPRVANQQMRSAIKACNSGTTAGAHDSPHFHTIPKVPAKIGNSASIAANRSIKGSSRTSGMVGMRS